MVTTMKYIKNIIKCIMYFLNYSNHENVIEKFPATFEKNNQKVLIKTWETIVGKYTKK